MKNSSILRFVLTATVLISFCCSFLKAENLIVDNDTLYNVSGAYDTIIVRNNGVIYANYPGATKLFLLESGGRIIGRPGYQSWIGASGIPVRIVNNSGPNAFDSITISLQKDNYAVPIGGKYPSTIYGLFSGWSTRSIRMDTTLTITGRIYCANDIKIQTNGNDLILGPDAYFEKPVDNSAAIVLEGDGRVIKKIRPGGFYIIPVSESGYGFPVRTDIIVRVNPGAVLGTDPSIILKVHSDSIYEAGTGLALTNYLKKFVSVEFSDVPSPDFDISMEVSQFDLDKVGDYNQMRNCCWNGSSWEYQKPLNWLRTTVTASEQLFVEWKNLKVNSAIITAGLDFGRNTPGCYPPTNVRLSQITDNTVRVLFDTITLNSYKIYYRQKATSPWSIAIPAKKRSEDTLSGLTASKAYEIQMKSICKSGADSSSLTDIITFKTSLPNYRYNNNRNVFVINSGLTDTIPGYIRWDSIIVKKNATAIANCDIVFTTPTSNFGAFIVDTAATLYMYTYGQYGANSIYVRAQANLHYGMTYLKGSLIKYYSQFRNTRQQIFNTYANYYLEGGQAGFDGQIIDDNFPARVNNLYVNSSVNVAFRRNPIEIGGAMYIQAGNFIDGGGLISFSGSGIINNLPNCYIRPACEFVSKNCVVDGTNDVVFGNVTVKKKTADTAILTLNRNINIRGTFSLDVGKVNLNNKMLAISGITLANGRILSDAGGIVKYMIKGYGLVTIPYGTAVYQTLLPVNFVSTAANLTDSSYITFEMFKGIHPQMGLAPVDYLNRYITITPYYLSNLRYNVSMKYETADVSGDESNMEVTIYDGAQWINSYRNVDTLNNLASWDGLTIGGSITAGNYVGYDTAVPVNLSVKDITTNGATIDWDFLDDGVTSWTVYYRTGAGAWQNKVVNSTTAMLTGLSSNSAYKCFVATTQTAGYDTIGSSDTLSFTTMSGSCNQPVGFNMLNRSYTSATLSWTGGTANYTIEYKHLGESWAAATSLPSTDTVETITGLDTARIYIARVQSACGSWSDSLIFHTRIPGWDSVTNNLYITSAIDIPYEFTFNKIFVENGGTGRLIKDITFIDSLIVKKGSILVCDSFVIRGFCFHAMDSNSTIKTAHVKCFMQKDSLDGSIQTTVRNYGQKVYYVFNGRRPQQMDNFLSSMYYVTIDNPTTVTTWPKNFDVRDLVIEKGVLLTHSKTTRIMINPLGKLVNNSGENALNNKKANLVLSGGALNAGTAAKVLGPQLVYVDSLSISTYDEPVIKSDIRIAKKLNVVNNVYMYGYILDNATITLDPGCKVTTDFGNYIAMKGNAKIRMMLDASMTDVNYTLPLGDTITSPTAARNNTYVTLRFNKYFNSFGPNGYVDITLKDAVHPNNGAEPNTLSRYINITPNDISQLDMNVGLNYLDADIIGSEGALLNSYYNGTWWAVNPVNSSANFISFNRVTEGGDFTARGGIDIIDTLLPANGSVDVLPSAGVSAKFTSGVTMLDYSGISIIGDNNVPAPGVSGSWDNGTKTLTVNHSALNAGSGNYTALLPANSIAVGTDTCSFKIAWSFRTSRMAAPVAYMPANAAVNIPVTNEVSVIFPEKVDSVDFSGIMIINTTSGDTLTGVSGLLGTDSLKLTIAHPVLPSASVIKVIVPLGTVQSIANQYLNDDISWSFTTTSGIPNPTVFIPGNGTTNSVPSSEIALVFDRPITAVNLSKVLLINFTLDDTIPTITPSINGDTLFVGNPTLNFNTRYKVIIPAGTVRSSVESVNNNLSYWVFSTMEIINASTVYPAVAATGVASTTSVVVTFGQAIDSVDFSGIMIENLTVPDTLTGIIGSVSNDSLIISHPKFPLSSQIRVTVPQGAIMASATLAPNMQTQWTFTTYDGIPVPSVYLPSNGATGTGYTILTGIKYNTNIVESNFSLVRVINVTENDTLSAGIVVSISSDTLKIAHPAFEYGDIYKIDVPAGTVKSAGDSVNNLSVSWSFTTLAAPAVTAVSPLNNSTGVSPAVAIYADFNLALTGVALTQISIYDTAAHTNVAGVVASVLGNRLTITHPSLTLNTVYKVNIPDSVVSNLFGAFNDSVTWMFRVTAVSVPEIAAGIIEIYPNPANNTVSILNTLEPSVAATIELIDVNGIVMKKVVMALQNLITIDISDLHSGLFILRIDTGKAVVEKRLIKQ